jgi:DNA-binding response OmpR family regulator
MMSPGFTCVDASSRISHTDTEPLFINCLRIRNLVVNSWTGSGIKSVTMSTPPKKILVIEDDPDIRNLVELHLRDVGYDVAVEETGSDGLSHALNGPVDLVVLDLMLPGVDGLDICRRLRAEKPHVPVLMLTARSTELDRVLGLELGADDYLTKPFSVRELMARIKAIFRRIESIEAEPPADSVEIGKLTIDADRRQVRIKGRPIDLTAREFDLLAFFAHHPGRVFTRGQLLDQVWGYAHEGYEHTVNTHINRLRRKLEDDPSHPKYILTVWGVGYRFPAAEEIE